MINLCSHRTPDSHKQVEISSPLGTPHAVGKPQLNKSDMSDGEAVNKRWGALCTPKYTKWKK